MKKLISFLFIWPVYIIASGQQDAQFSQNMFNKLAFNPGFAGMTHGQCISMIYRNQWVGFPGAPVTTMLNLNSYVPVIKGGVGFTAAEDKLGNEKNFSAELSGSHHFNIFNGEISLGGRAGWMQKSFFDNWIATDGVQGDGSIPVAQSPMSYLDLGAGAFYLGMNDTYVGLSATHAFNTGNSIANHYFKNVPHYYVTAGTKIPLPFMRSIVLKPSVLAKSDGRVAIFDVNMLALIKDKFWVGGSYRMTDAVVVMAGFMWGSLKIGYAYDITTSEIKDHSSNTHELMVSYCFKIIPKKPCTTHINPRLMGVGPPGRDCGCITSKCVLMNVMNGEPNSVE